MRLPAQDANILVLDETRGTTELFDLDFAESGTSST